jgi:hypothetical protein
MNLSPGFENEWPIGFRRYRTITGNISGCRHCFRILTMITLWRGKLQSHSVSSQQAIWPNICAAYSSGISFRVLLYGHFISTITHRVWSRRVRQI